LRRVGFEVCLATSCHISVMFDLVRTTTLLTFGAVSFIQKGKMTLFPTIMALRDTWIHVSASDSGYISAKVKRMINKQFGLRSILGIPYINLDDGHI